VVDFLKLLIGWGLNDLSTIECRVDRPSRLDRVEEFSVPVERGNGTPFRESPPDEFLVFLEIGVVPMKFRFTPVFIPPTKPVGVRSSLGIGEIQGNEFPILLPVGVDFTVLPSHLDTCRHECGPVFPVGIHSPDPNGTQIPRPRLSRFGCDIHCSRKPSRFLKTIGFPTGNVSPVGFSISGIPEVFSVNSNFG
jgi:hypothetical protein